MKKKIFTLFLALVVSVGTMFASDTSVGGIWYNFNNGNLTAEVTYQGYNYDSYRDRYSGEVVIPASVTYNAQTYTVTSIGDHAFFYCTGLTSVTIPNSVTSIGNNAFFGCSGLTSVTIPNSVTSIGNYAFCSCTGLTSVTIPNSVNSIGIEAFRDCASLSSINVASDNSNYCSVDGVLFNKDKTTLIQYPGGKQGAYTIPNSVTSIGEFAFFYCSGLTSVTIPNSVTSIGGSAFCGCSGLTSITIPNSVTSIGDGAFKNCTSLTSVTIGNSVTSIGDGAFKNCTSLTSVTIGNSVTSIGYEAFYRCTGLTSVTIPNSVTSIRRSAFAGCSGLTSVTIGNSVTSIGGYAFNGCSSLTSVTNYATTPQTIESDVFGGNDFYPGVDKSTCVLNVPNESVSLYQAAEGWKEFTNILPISQQGLEDVQGNNLQCTKVYHEGQIFILRGEKVYSIDGRKVK